MRTERKLIAFHGAAAMLALAAATIWPRAGQAALLVPLAAQDVGDVAGWAAREGAPLLLLDTASGRVVARVPDSRVLLSALRAGLLPVAARAGGCQPPSMEVMR